MADRATDIHTLARVMHSEFASGTDLERAAIGWATVNEAAHDGMGVTEYVTKPFGTYGSQEGGRPVASGRPPPASSTSWEIARRIVDGESPDVTYGAVRFFDPSTQDAMHAKWLRGQTSVRYRSAAEIIAKWGAEGYEPYVLEGTRGSELVLFRRVGAAVPATYAGIVPAGDWAWAVAGAAVALWWLRRRRRR